MKTLKTFIKFLLEKRSNSEMNQKLSPIEQLRKYENNADNTYISFTRINKIGINPKSQYQTPNGIYTYHLYYVFKNVGRYNNLDNVVPFAGDAPFIWVGVPTKPVLILQQYTPKMFYADIEKLRTFFTKEKMYEDEFDAKIKHAANEAYHQSHGGLIWNITRSLSENPNNWNYLLRVVLSYHVIRDDGQGIIHPYEPYQAVFLSKEAFKEVEKINNKIERFDTYGQKQALAKKKELSEYKEEILQKLNKFFRTESFDDLNNLANSMEIISDSQNEKFTWSIFFGIKNYNKLIAICMNQNSYYFSLAMVKLTNDKKLLEFISENKTACIKFLKYTQIGKAPSFIIDKVSDDPKACYDILIKKAVHVTFDNNPDNYYKLVNTLFKDEKLTRAYLTEKNWDVNKWRIREMFNSENIDQDTIGYAVISNIYTKFDNDGRYE